MELADKAAELIRDHWIRGMYQTVEENPRFCLVGGITYAYQTMCGEANTSEKLTALSIQRSELFQAIRSWAQTDDIEWWNDEPERTEDQVLEVLKLAGEEVDLKREGKFHATR